MNALIWIGKMVVKAAYMIASRLMVAGVGTTAAMAIGFTVVAAATVATGNAVMGRLTKIPDIGLTAFAQAMPDQYKNENVVKAYRDYYINEKSSFLTWTKRKKPKWINND